MTSQSLSLQKAILERSISGDHYGWYDTEEQDDELPDSESILTGTSSLANSLFGLIHPTAEESKIDLEVTPRDRNEALSRSKRETLSGRHRTFLVWTEDSDQASAGALIRRISELDMPNFQVKPVNSENFNYELTQAYAPETVVVLPGGQGRHYDRLLKEHKSIRRVFYDAGGSEFAVCAGAFFGTKRSSYNLSSGETIYKVRDEWFLDGLAEGPLFQAHKEVSVLAPHFSHQLSAQRSSASLQHRLVRWMMPVEDRSFQSIGPKYVVGDGHNVGGGYFIPSEELRKGVDYEPVLLYKAERPGEEDKIAALRVSPTKRKQGNWVGTMVHPEFYTEDLADLFESNVTLRETFPDTVDDLARVASYDPGYKIARSASDLLLLSLLDAVTTPTDSLSSKDY